MSDLTEAFRQFRIEHDSRIAESISSAIDNLPTASTSTKGGVKIGDGLTMEGDTLSVNQASVMAKLTAMDGKLDSLLTNCDTETAATTKLEPTLEVSDGSYTYNGDGQIFGYVSTFEKAIEIDRVNKTYTLVVDETRPYIGDPYTVWIHATEGTNYAAKTAFYEYEAY